MCLSGREQDFVLACRSADEQEAANMFVQV